VHGGTNYTKTLRGVIKMKVVVRLCSSFLSVQFVVVRQPTKVGMLRTVQPRRCIALMLLSVRFPAALKVVDKFRSFKLTPIHFHKFAWASPPSVRPVDAHVSRTPPVQVFPFSCSASRQRVGRIDLAREMSSSVDTHGGLEQVAAEPLSNEEVVRQFAAQPFVQEALDQIVSMSDTGDGHLLDSLAIPVLSFFFNYNPHNLTDYQKKIVEGHCLHSPVAITLWYEGGPSYDALCRPFAPLIQAVGGGMGAVASTSARSSLVEQRVAAMILCDQLARNVFRGTTQAFAYENAAKSACQFLYDEFARQSRDPQGTADHDTIHPPYLAFMVTCLMHSENIEDHVRGAEVVDYAISRVQENYQGEEADGWIQVWEASRMFLNNHTEVLQRFGRYPHRNVIMNRGHTTTKEEQAWLDDDENLPGWAKSQVFVG
jgi:uncharacterized protein (DUF924 family)